MTLDMLNVMLAVSEEGNDRGDAAGAAGFSSAGGVL